MSPIPTEAYVARGPTTADTSGLSNLQLESVTYGGLGGRDVLVELVAAGICHSDVRAAQGVFHLKPPLILGHEGAGVVKEVGGEVRDVVPGDRVVLSYASCGHCRRCLAGRAPYCERLWELNFAETMAATDQGGNGLKNFFFGQSSMARLVLAREESVVKVEVEEAELKFLAPLGCGIQTGAGGIL